MGVATDSRGGGDAVGFAAMGMLRRCSIPGCTTLTLSRVCAEHEHLKVPVPPAHAVPPVAARK